MSIAFQITSEGDDFDDAFARLEHIVRFLSLMLPAVRDLSPRDGVAQGINVGKMQIGSFSIEDDDQMNGRMRLRRVGAAVPAFERERRQYGHEKEAERDGPRTEVTESWDTGRGE